MHGAKGKPSRKLMEIVEEKSDDSSSGSSVSESSNNNDTCAKLVDEDPDHPLNAIMQYESYFNDGTKI